MIAFCVLVERAAHVGHPDGRVVLFRNLFHLFLGQLPKVVHHLLELVQRDAV